MTVGELIELLSQQPRELPVVVNLGKNSQANSVEAGRVRLTTAQRASIDGRYVEWEPKWELDRDFYGPPVQIVTVTD